MFLAQYEVLRERGHSPSEAFNETVEEATQSLYPLIGGVSLPICNQAKEENTDCILCNRTVWIGCLLHALPLPAVALSTGPSSLRIPSSPSSMNSMTPSRLERRPSARSNTILTLTTVRSTRLNWRRSGTSRSGGLEKLSGLFVLKTTKLTAVLGTGRRRGAQCGEVYRCIFS